MNHLISEPTHFNHLSDENKNQAKKLNNLFKKKKR